MDFNKLSQQASSFMNKQNNSANQGSADPNMNTNTGGMSNTTSDTDMGGNSSMAGTNTNTDNSNEDYVDKGLDFIEKKTGHTLSRDQNEKITDGARGLFEKMTGKKIDPKYSN